MRISTAVLAICLRWSFEFILKLQVSVVAFYYLPLLYGSHALFSGLYGYGTHYVHRRLFGQILISVLAEELIERWLAAFFSTYHDSIKGY